MHRDKDHLELQTDMEIPLEELLGQIAIALTEQAEIQEATLTIDDQEYKVNDLRDDSKTHYVEVINLRNQVSQLHNQINGAHQQALN